MMIRSISVTRFGPFQQTYETVFNPDTNVVIGPSGGGKTTMMRILAGLTGIDDTTFLIAGREVGHCRLELEHEGEEISFTARGRFDEEMIRSFKNALPARTSFPVTEWQDSFPSRCLHGTLGWRNFRRYCDARGERGQVGGPASKMKYDAKARRIEFWAGDGHRRALMLFLNDTPKGIPLLLENPGMSIDIWGKRLIVDFLERDDRQLIFTNHCPEMMASRLERVIEVKSC